MQNPLPFEIKLQQLRMKVEGHESVPRPKIVGSGFSYVFKKVLNWNYMMLMPSASPYTQCLIAPGAGIRCLLGTFYTVR